MLKAPSRLSRSTSPRWAKFTALTERVCRGSRPGKSSLETLWKCLVRDVKVPHGESVLIFFFLNGLSGARYIFSTGEYSQPVVSNTLRRLITVKL